MNLFISILGLAALILVHEAGHFFTARAVGMSPRRFYLGFPPALVKTTRKGIEYGIGAIPLGGYVKIPGMHRPAPSDVDMHFGRALTEAPQLVGPLTRLKGRFEEGDFSTATTTLQEVERTVEDTALSPEADKAARRGLTEIADGLGSDAYWRQATWKRVAVIFAGPGVNLVVAIAIFAVLFMLSGGPVTRTVDSVREGRPAETVGLRSGDAILAIGGRAVEPDGISQRIAASRGRPLTILVERDGRRVRLGPIRPRQDGGAYRLGFALRGQGLAAPQALWRSVKLTGIVTREIGASLGRLVRGSGREDISSPVGIVQGSSNALDQGLQNFLWVMGLISLSLALLNLLPLLPLDGGHIAFSLLEGLRGRAVGRGVYERFSAVGIALVLLLFFVGLTNDIGRLG